MTNVTPPAYATYIRAARQRMETASTRWMERREQAWVIARQATAFIKEKYPQASVRVFGSLLYPDSFGPRSDIDLALDGVGWPEYLHLWSALERQLSEFVIDLVDVNIVAPELRAHIEREGEPL